MRLLLLTLTLTLALAAAGCTDTVDGDHLHHGDDGHGHGDDDHHHGDDGHGYGQPSGQTLDVTLLSPGATAEQGPTTVRIEVTLDGRPVTDADVDVTAWMTTHDHGCGCDEPRATHIGDGVYETTTDFIMAGPWEVRVMAVRGADSGATIEAVTVE